MSAYRKSATAQLFLKGARVTSDFRDELFDAANRAGVSVNEFCITAAAEKLEAHGRSFVGVFSRRDFAVGIRTAPEVTFAEAAVRDGNRGGPQGGGIDMSLFPPAPTAFR